MARTAEMGIDGSPCADDHVHPTTPKASDVNSTKKPASQSKPKGTPTPKPAAPAAQPPARRDGKVGPYATTGEIGTGIRQGLFGGTDTYCMLLSNHVARGRTIDVALANLYPGVEDCGDYYTCAVCVQLDAGEYSRSLIGLMDGSCADPGWETRLTATTDVKGPIWVRISSISSYSDIQLPWRLSVTVS